MLKSISAFVFVHSREVVHFWEGPLREVPLYSKTLLEYLACRCHETILCRHGIESCCLQNEAACSNSKLQLLMHLTLIVSSSEVSLSLGKVFLVENTQRGGF